MTLTSLPVTTYSLDPVQGDVECVVCRHQCAFLNYKRTSESWNTSRLGGFREGFWTWSSFPSLKSGFLTQSSICVASKIIFLKDRFNQVIVLLWVLWRIPHPQDQFPLLNRCQASLSAGVYQLLWVQPSDGDWWDLKDTWIRSLTSTRGDEVPGTTVNNRRIKGKSEWNWLQVQAEWKTRENEKQEWETRGQCPQSAEETGRAGGRTWREGQEKEGEGIVASCSLTYSSVFSR